MSSSHISSWLFPISRYESGFSTTQSDIDHARVARVPLADSSVGVHKSSSRLTHNLVKPPTSGDHSPKVAWEAFFPEGSINPSATIAGGFGFYLNGPPEFAARLESATEVLFSYRVMFEDGWDFKKGGKLPGHTQLEVLATYRTNALAEGKTNDVNASVFVSCGGAFPGNGGKGEIYAYIPLHESNTDRLLQVPPESHKNPDFGFSVGRGSFKFPKGAWTTIAERVKLNTVGQADGEIQLWINGMSVIHISGLLLREEEASHIKGMHFQTFFGGNKSDWASPKDQKAWFADVSGAIIQ